MLNLRTASAGTPSGLTTTGGEAAGDAGGERLSLDSGWRFNLGDVPFPPVSGHQESYNNAKSGTAREHQVVIVLESEAGESVGLGGVVMVDAELTTMP